MRQSIYAAKEELSLLYDITTKILSTQKQPLSVTSNVNQQPSLHDKDQQQVLIAPFVLKNQIQTDSITLIKQLQESYVMKMKVPIELEELMIISHLIL